ncbi:AhpC/TSA family protein [Luteolibacter algae]
MKLVLIIAGLYHLIFAAWANFWPCGCYDLFGLQRPEHPALWRVIGLISGALGLALLLSARDPIRNWLIILLGAIKSILAVAFVVPAIARDDLPVTASWILLINDIIWLPPYLYILWAAIRAHAGIPPSRGVPYTIAEASAVYRLSSGETLAKASGERPLVLVFLRHFGCTFTRQILRGLQDLEREARKNNASLVLVHMLQSGTEVDYLGHNSNILRIADPRCELYRAFGLGKGGFLELFGPQVWWRGAISVIKGCGVGHLAGDGLQMPGAFVFHEGKIRSSQPARSAADLPDLASLFQYPPQQP